MKKINLGISGCMGRMGQQLIKSSKNNKDFNLKTLTEYKTINKKICGIKPELNSEEAFKKIDLIIDFTIPKCTLEVLEIAVKQKKRVIIGTTGFSPLFSLVWCINLSAWSLSNTNISPHSLLLTDL